MTANMIKLRFSIVVLSAMLWCSGIRAGDQVTLGILDGLAGESVYDVMTDHGGRVWLATANGVNMFNGNQLTSYSLTNREHRIVTASALCETRDNTIYVATDIGLFQLKPGSEHFEQTLPNVLQPECLLAVGDSMFIGGRQGIQVFDGQKLNTIHLGQSRKGIDNIVRHYVQDADGRIWFLGRYDLFLFDRKSSSFKAQGISSLLPERATPSQFDIVDNKCFIGTKADGFYMIDLGRMSVRRIEEVGHIVTSVRRTADGNICVGTNGAGAYLIDSQNGEVLLRFSTNGGGGNKLPTNAVNCYYRDSQGVDWLGMVRYGLTYTYHSDALFQPFRVGEFSTAGLNVRSYCIRGDEGVIGTQNGLYFLKNGHASFYSSDMMGGSHIVNNIVFYRGEYYIGTFDGGISVLNPKTGILRPLGITSSLQKSSIGDIEVGPDSLLWIGTNDGLFVIDDSRVHHWFTEQNSHVQGGMILDITFDSEGNAWLTGANGLSIYGGRIGEIVSEPNFPDDFFNHQPWCRGFVGHDNMIFMRNGPQVFYTDAQMKHYGELSLPVTLPDVWCRDFIDDMSGHYWISSEMGLFRLDYDGSGLLRLGSGAGLKGSHINEMSYDGQWLWVATSEGLYYFSPKDFAKWSINSSYKLYLYQIRRGSQLLSSGEELLVNETKRLTVDWNLGAEQLHLMPVLLDYAQQSGRMYEYSIDGQQWNMVLPGGGIVLDGLSLGSHKLSVRLAGISGTMTDFQLTVSPSLGAIIELLSLIALILILWVAYRYRRNTKVLLTERNEIEEALIESEEQRMKVEEWADIDQKYQKVKIDPDECEEIVSRMRRMIEEDKVYTNTDLKMKDLADELRLSPSKLSQVFNLYLKENYYDFINRYRLEEFKRLIAAGEHKRMTITALSEECGFKKSSFFSTFRKVEGMTPAEYLKKKGVKA